MAVEMAVERWHRDGIREVRASPIDVVVIKSKANRIESQVESGRVEKEE